MAKNSPDSTALLRWSTFFFFFSGATGLIYQVLWTRRLTLVFGHTVLAVSTVLTAFMAGLALGSLLAGRWTDRHAGRPAHKFLADYGYLEGFIGLWAVLSLPMLGLVEKLYLYMAATGLSGPTLHLGCFAAAACVLVPPTTAMGATVPLLSRLLVQQQGEVGQILSRLYGLNTMGALLGAFLGGFALLPLLGLQLTTLLAALVNVAIAVGAVGKARSTASSAGSPRPKAAQAAGEPVGRSGAGWIPLSFGLAGAASMGYQVAWNRSLCLAIGSSVYAFSTILVLFLAGLGLGSLLYPRLMQHRNPEVFHLAVLYLAIGISGAFTVVVIPWLPGAFYHLFPLAGNQFGLVLLIDFLLVGILLLPPTLCMGLGFPLATAIYSRSLESLGRSVGNVYGANTVGCILGAFFTGFVLVPWLGAQSTLQLACLLYLVNALGLSLLSSSLRRWALVAASLAASGLTLVLPRWQTAVLASGAAIYSVNRSDQYREPPAVYLDGMSSAVSFHLDGENWDIPNMRVNGKVDASVSKGDRLTQHLLGYLPTLIHPAPAHVGVIGLGGGFTVEAVIDVPGVKSIDVAELEPAVVKIGEYWKPFNSRALEDPRVKVHVQDGRTLVLVEREPFDVLISEPSNPWIAGIGSLFTRDFYLVARDRLRPDGIMCQWFNLYAVSQTDMKMVVRSFYDVFPHGQLWQSSGGDLVLLGSQQPLKYDVNRVRQAWKETPSMQRHFYEGGVTHPDCLLGHYLMTREKALEMAGSGPFNSDDRPLLEFSAPFSLYQSGEVHRNLEVLGKFASGFPPGVTLDAGMRVLAAVGILNRDNYALVKKELERLPITPETIAMAASVRFWEKGPEDLDNVRALFAGGLEKFPKSTLLAAEWADLEFDNREFEKAASLYQAALQDPPPGSKAYLFQKLGLSFFYQGDGKNALPALVRSAELNPHASLALAMAGGAATNLEDYPTANQLLKLALYRNPHDPAALKYLATVRFQEKNFAEAEQLLLRFLDLCPNYAHLWLRLADARVAQGNLGGASKAANQALKLAPGDPEIFAAVSKLPR